MERIEVVVGRLIHSTDTKAASLLPPSDDLFLLLVGSRQQIPYGHG
jgi:hypothetical protein